MKIAIYSRKSRESDKGQSIQNQINMCKAYFQIHNTEAEFFIFQDDGFSGSTINRPDFQQMMLLSEQNLFDIVCVYKIDRIARNITDFFQIYKSLEEHNVKLVSITENFDASTPIGKMMMTLLAGFADMERENIKQRITDNLYELAKLGRWTGGKVPLGYKSKTIIENGKKNTYLELIPEEIPRIRQIFELAKTLLPYQIYKKTGISNKSLIFILRNPVYIKSDKLSQEYFTNNGYKFFGIPNGCGLIGYNRSRNSHLRMVSVGRHDAVIDSSTWITVNNILDNKLSVIRPRISSLSFLAHITYCKECGSLFNIATSRIRKDGKRRIFLRCSTHREDKDKCSFVSVDCNIIENGVIDYLCAITKTKNEFLKIVKHTNIDDKSEILREKIREAERTLREKESILQATTEKLPFLTEFALNVVNEKINTMGKEINTLKQKLLTYRQSLLALDGLKIEADFLYIKIKETINILKSTCSIEEKQAAVNMILKRILVSKDNELEFEFVGVI